MKILSSITNDKDITSKEYVDGKIPTKTSDLTNDSGFITGYNETDPTVPSWAKQSTKPSYEASEIEYTNEEYYTHLTYGDDFTSVESIKDFADLLLLELDYDIDGIQTQLDRKQTKLYSGANIKTINNTSLLGSGDISIGGSLTIDDVYPVGSIYMSVNSTNPTTLFGGTWQRIKDTFLLACGDTYSNGATGGEATHTLTTDEMPSHTHIQNAHKHKWLGRKTSWGSSGGNNVLIDNTGSSYSAVSAVANNGIDETTATNQNTGGGLAHNNMPPYLAVYMWQRTA